jgi:hypothetical protein
VIPPHGPLTSGDARPYHRISRAGQQRRIAAAALWGEGGTFAHDAYVRNRHLFPGLPELPIVIGPTAYGRCTGLTRASWPHGPRISLFSAEFARAVEALHDEPTPVDLDGLAPPAAT